jgi:hypothetical protein
MGLDPHERVRSARRGAYEAWLAQALVLQIEDEGKDNSRNGIP